MCQVCLRFFDDMILFIAKAVHDGIVGRGRMGVEAGAVNDV